MRFSLFLVLTLTIPMLAAPAPIEPPQSPDPTIRISLFAAEPDIVTPIGATVDSKGRLLVIESHSHFRPKDYKGPPTDRIRILEDTTGSGKADRITSFYEGGAYLMHLAAEPDGSILVSSRNEIFRLTPVDGAAPTKTTLAHLETKSDYPHNGLHGLTRDPAGNIYIGLGENLGGPWTLIGTDGIKLSDDKGSGVIFRIDSKGNHLTRIARGFWNPFGLGLDPLGNLWAVDNDPDGRPPCRLIHILEGADYGFEFRYGRTGAHPLQCWDGELPGTLGMTAGVGEAPCAVQWRQGRLIVTSWRDHQVQSVTLSPRGASYSASVDTLLQGDENFRPVGLAQSPDGALYVTDWSNKSYPVHGQGRIWKITSTVKVPASELKPTDEMARAAALRTSLDIPALLLSLNDPDAAVAQAAQFGLSKLPDAEKIPFATLNSPVQRIGLLTALLTRGSDLTALATDALKDENDRVRQMAVRCVTEQNIKAARPQLEQLLQSTALSPRLLGMTVAAITQLDGDRSARVDPKKINAVLLARLAAPDTTDTARAAALGMLQMNHPKIPLDQLKGFLASGSQPVQLEAARYLAADKEPGRFAVLAQVAADPKNTPDIRAEAVLGLSDDAANQADLLLKLAADPAAAVRQEALRSLRPAAPKLTAAQKDQLEQRAKQLPTDAPLITRLLGTAPPERPPESDIKAWQKTVDKSPGDPEAGRRIFFHPAGPACSRCHTLEGRGHAIGPDLSMIGHSQTADHVLESILDPSREIAPLFSVWTIKTKQGQIIDGMLLRRDGQANEVYVDTTGVEVTIKEPDIIDRKMRKESLMPTGLVQGLTDQELRDLLAYLTQKR